MARDQRNPSAEHLSVQMLYFYVIYRIVAAEKVLMSESRRDREDFARGSPLRLFSLWMPPSWESYKDNSPYCQKFGERGLMIPLLYFAD